MIEIVQAKSLTNVQGTAQRVYNIQIIATKPGFQVVAQHGSLGKKLTEVDRSARALNYATAFSEFEAIVAAKINTEGYDVTSAKIPNKTTLYAAGHKFVQPTEEFLRDNNPDTWNPASSATAGAAGAPGSVPGPAAGVPTRLAAALVATTTRVEDPSLAIVAIEKRGGQITLTPEPAEPHVRRCALRAALELGGDFKAEGVAVSARFHLRSIDKRNLLDHTRPNWVTQAPAPQRSTADLLRSLMGGELPTLVARLSAGSNITFTQADFAAAAEINPDILAALA
jgi:hypothetical protein